MKKEHDNTAHEICDLQKRVHDVARSKGWYDAGGPSFGDAIANVHAELSEAWEGYRHNNPPSEHIPDFSAIEEELADVVIRVLDICEHNGHRLYKAIIAKTKYNRTRKYKHGGKKV